MSKIILSMDVIGRPATQGSKRAFAIRGKDGKHRAIVTEDNLRNKDWRALISTTAARFYCSAPYTGPIELEVCVRLARPKGHFRTGRNIHLLSDSAPLHHTQTPDLFKLVRPIEDALTGIVWKDDSQIVRHTNTRKEWTSGQPGASVLVFALEEE